MLAGQALGKAIEAAIKAKGVRKTKLAEIAGVAPSSVTGWIKSGRIDRDNLLLVMAYFADVVGPEHWGLSDPIQQPAYRDVLYHQASDGLRSAVDEVALALLELPEEKAIALRDLLIKLSKSKDLP